MDRTGRTARPLKASGPEVTAYALVMSAAMLRVFLPLVLTNLLLGAVLAWTAAVCIYLVTYTLWLMRTRLDDQDG